MSELSKILATIGVVVLFVIIFGAIVGSMSDAGQTPGILGLIVLGALIGALRAIWKKPKNNEKKRRYIHSSEVKQNRNVQRLLSDIGCFFFSPKRGDKEGIQKEITGMASGQESRS